MLTLIVFAIAVPFSRVNFRATGSSADSKPWVARSQGPHVEDAVEASMFRPASPPPAEQDVTDGVRSSRGKVSFELLNALGIAPSDKYYAATGLDRKIKHRNPHNGSSRVRLQSGQPLALNARSALSAAVITTLGGRDNQFSEVALIADWDGREDCTADHAAEVDDFSGIEADVDFTLTRAAISEHTIANGFNEDVFYYGDSVGNLWIGMDADGNGQADSVQQINIPELINTGSSGGVPLLNSAQGDCADDELTVTGIAVNPVADLGDFGECGMIGEVVYVSVLDTEGCGADSSNQTFRTRVLEFCLVDLDSNDQLCGEVTAFTEPNDVSLGQITIGGRTFVIRQGAPPIINRDLIQVGANICICPTFDELGQITSILAHVILPNGQPSFFCAVNVIGARQILRHPLFCIGGVAVDGAGGLFIHLADAINVGNGGAIFKATEIPRIVPACGTSPRINRVISPIPTPFGLGSALGTAPSPVIASAGVRLTNYSGPSNTFGNIVAIACGPDGTLYAAVARSFNASDDISGQLTEGLFSSPSALGPTPSMILSFADCSGGFDSCTSPAPGIPGIFPVGDGFADVAQNGLTKIPGVNNFRIFVLGNGPDIRPGTGVAAAVPGTLSSVLKLDMQIDFTIHSGLAVNEEGTVFVISGGAPAGVGKDPSPMLGEILCFEDRCPMDRRADFIDFRGDLPPNPPSSGGNRGDGDSDRFDHIFHQAPLDQVTLTPAGLAGLARGFLRHTNRLAPNPISPGVTLGLVGGQTVQGDDDTSGPILFENLDPGHQVAGGDDQNPPFTGDDRDGVADPDTPNNPALVGPLSGGFEFLFGATGVPGSKTTPCINNVWNAFFLNSNGNITFNGGDADDTPSVLEFRSRLPKIAPAWANLNPDARSVNTINFPVQALGFANVNAFTIRWLNVPEAASESCSTSRFGIGGNTLSITLYDDGTGLDENVQQTASAEDFECERAFVECTLDEFTLEDVCIDLYDTCLSMKDRVVEGPTAFRFATVFDGLFGGAVTGDCDDSGLGGICVDQGCRRKSSNRAGCDTRTCSCSNKEIVACSLFPPDSGPFLFSYGRMDLLGTPERPVITGYSEGGASPLNPPGLCETNLSAGAIRADASPFGLIDGQTASIEACLLGQGTEPHIFELFNEGRDAKIGAGGEITLAAPDFDLRFEGNDPVICTPLRQRDINRDKVGFFGKTCPVNPITISAKPRGGMAVAPGQPSIGSPEAGSQRDSAGNRTAMPTSGIINAVGKVQLSVVGCGFFPDETTTICQGFDTNTGVPLQRPGKTVSTSAAIACDTNGDGIPDVTVPLANVTPVNSNLVRTTLPTLTGTGLPGTAFPLACCGGLADLTLTTTFTPGDNNQFGLFTRTASLSIDLGVRAPVVLSATPNAGDCSVLQDLLISGACFTTPQGSVTSVFAVERDDPSNVLQAMRFVVLTPGLIDAAFNFGSANAGKTFLIFAAGPGGTSRNLTTLPPGAEPGCPLGNEQGIQVTFTCQPEIVQSDVPVISACNIESSASGAPLLVVSGSNFKDGATVMVGGKKPKKIRFEDFQAGSNSFNRLVLKGRFCGGLPGAVVITNPGGKAASPFQCDKSC